MTARRKAALPLPRTGALAAKAGAHTAFAFGEGIPLPPRRRKSDAEISAEALRLQAERAKYESSGMLSVTDAKLILQRRGRMVYRSSVDGGDPELWTVSGLGREVTDEQLVAAAERFR